MLLLACCYLCLPIECYLALRRGSDNNVETTRCCVTSFVRSCALDRVLTHREGVPRGGFAGYLGVEWIGVCCRDSVFIMDRSSALVLGFLDDWFLWELKGG